MGPKAACSPRRSSSVCSSTCKTPPFNPNLRSCSRSRKTPRIPAALLCLLASSFCLPTSAPAGDKKLTDEDRVELLRGLTAEYATVKTYLPRSKKPLPFESTGTWDKQKWEEMGREFGPAARVGDQVQVT